MSGAILIERLDQQLGDLGLTDREASLRATGTPDLIRDLRRSKSQQMRTGNLTKLASALEVDAAWLTGEQNERRRITAANQPPQAQASISLTDTEMELLSLYRAMPDQQDHVLAVIRALYGVNQQAAADDRGRRKVS
ncbi:hypothetical protein [Hyphobacterium sp.]|uniref:hypothetical protein n=1 Tax=Hyphobacterium sp. TaxID=2004662 RepID=UPI003BA93ACC